MNKSDLSNKILAIAPSGSISIAQAITELREKGEKIIGLNVGEPDFKTPEVVLNATKKALDSGRTKYSLVSGERELRDAIAKYFFARTGTVIGAQNILVGNGSKQIIYNAFQAILNDGDEVIIPVPYWVTIPESVKLAGGVSKFVPSQKDFHLDLDAIKAAVSKNSKAIYINTPNNPTGIVYNEKELLALGEIAKEHNLWIIADEAYESLTYDRKFVAINTLSEDLFERTICIQSFSKTFCMTGFRLGYMIANEVVIKEIDKFQGHLCGNVAPFTQLGAVDALAIHEQISFPLVEEMKKRRDITFELFSKLFDCHKPEGAFYLFLDISKYIKSGLVKNSAEMVELLIRDAKVALVPGSAFGQEGFIRLAYTASIDELKQAYEQIAKVLA
ncbi:pyridoxal phosphate-dependent aminotransferase [Bacteriovorax sp. Seq25_V]|uniref:pyridoxal phosphate-dependent aminotransferase n=1 Tax=Bacteriovorax sp. Seq25_V TaxID=1201288 RepID=UPI00038A0036|nr:pyridoxal phosphate-dependent aminotransferase [Bacteriovorax sp. Seq25_V]EQC45560.1 putative aspartate transaminase [Bacteriovorax sp. Seq25_V]